jgi:hypothetical protein
LTENSKKVLSLAEDYAHGHSIEVLNKIVAAGSPCSIYLVAWAYTAVWGHRCRVVCGHTYSRRRFSLLYICVRILLYICVLNCCICSCYCMCPHTTVCVLILLCVSSYYCMCATRWSPPGSPRSLLSPSLSLSRSLAPLSLLFNELFINN